MKIHKLHKIGIVCCVLLISLFFLYQYLNRGIANTASIQTEESFTTHELLSKFQHKQEKLAGFIEKAIEIEGEIKDITIKDGKYSLILKGDSEQSYILCEMQSDQNADVKKLLVGQDVKLKGILKGFLLDVILLHCVII